MPKRPPLRRRPGRPSSPWLPFVNTSGEPANEPLSDGLTDELIGALGKVPGLQVIGRTSAFALKGKTLDVRAVGDTLGAGRVVEATVRRAGDRIKVTAQLVDAGDGAVLWSDGYDRPLADVLAVQEEIARSIVAALRMRLAGTRSGVPAARATDDPDAYELYLRGRHIFYTRPDRDGIMQAARYFRRALERDPSHARAHAGMSDVHTRLAVFGFGRPKEEFARAKAAAHRALALDSTLAEAHVSLAHARCVADFDWRGAERGFRRAVTLDPSFTFARVPFAICLMSEGRFVEAVAQLDTARASDPLAPAPSSVLGRVHVAARRPELAIRHLREVLELNPQMDLAHQQLGHAYLLQGRHAEAIAALERAAALNGARDSAHLAYGYAVAGQRARAEGIVGALVASTSRRYVPPFHLALAYAGLGDADRAFRWLDRGLDERGSFMNGVKVTPAFDGLHGDARWPRLLGRMGLRP